MAHISGKARVATALASIALAAGIVVACDNNGYNNGYDNCPDYQCGDGLFLIPFILHPAVGIYGQPGYVAPIIIQPGQPNYRPSYQGKPPNFTPPSGAKVNPPGAKPPSNYKPPSGSTLTVQKAPKPSGNVQPGGTGSQKSGSNQTVQKSPSGGGSKPGGSSGGGSKSGGGGKK